MANMSMMAEMFMEVCNRIAEEVRVVVDGTQFKTIVLDEEQAQAVVKDGIQNHNKVFHVLSLKDALDFSYRNGYNDALREIKGSSNDEDTQFRQCDLSQEKE